MVIIALILALLVQTPTPAPTDNWRVWLYDSTTGSIKVINPSGLVVGNWSLPLVGFTDAPIDVFVSGNGQYVAYSGALDANAPYPLVIYDTRDREIVYSGPILMDDASETQAMLATAAFSGRQVAVSYFVHPETSAGHVSWGVKVLDIAQGDVSHTMDVPPQLTKRFSDNYAYTFPQIENFDGRTVEFTLIPGGAEAFPGTPLFAWDITTGAVREIHHYTADLADISPATGEALAPAQDARFGPLVYCAGPGLAHMPFNVVHVYNPTDNTRIPVYRRANFAPVEAYFIQNEQRIMVEECGTVEPARVWTVVERGGSPVAEFVMPSIVRSVQGTPNGFVYLGVVDATLPGANTQVLISVLMHIRTDDNRLRQTLLWYEQSGVYEWQVDPGIYELDIIHIDSDVPPTQGFPAWQQLAKPVPAKNYPPVTYPGHNNGNTAPSGSSGSDDDD